ncbi:MAG TPA: hypothetical protein P5081_05490, partial [Phycisphaerae bacterium]|nr:hypothetical protein [Phycisphaerae bacterium]
WVLIPLGVLWVIWRVAVLVWRLTGRSNRAYNITMSVIMLGLWGLVGYGLAGNLDLRSRIEHISQAEQQINQRLAPQLREQEQLIDQLVKLSNQPRGVSYSDTPDKLLHVIDTLIEKQQALIDFDIVGAFREALSDRGFNESQLNQMASVNPIMIDMVRRERLLKAQLDLFRTIRQIHVIESAPPARFARQQRDELYVELDRLQAIVDALEQPPAPQAHPNGT